MNKIYSFKEKKHSGIIREKKTSNNKTWTIVQFNHMIFSIAGDVFSFKFDAFSMNASYKRTEEVNWWLEEYWLSNTLS